MRPIEFSSIDRPAQVDPGVPPMLQWIKIADLVIDDQYQRELKPGNWKVIRRIAAGFKWSRFSPVFVAPVEGGKYAVIDGQHRTHAAAICGITEVPCQIVQMTRAEQAASFAAVNGLVTKVTPWQIYKAALTAESKWAVLCHKICADAGCTLMTRNSGTDDKKAGEVYALALVKTYADQGKGEQVTFAFAALRKSEAGAEPQMWTNEILKPLLAAVVDRPWLAKQAVDLAAFLDKVSLYEIVDKAAETVRMKRRQGAVGVSKYDFAAAALGEKLDRAFPQRMAMPRAAA